MSKQVRLEDSVYDKLYAFQSKGETFSEAVDMLLSTREELCRLLDILEGMIKFREWQREQLEKVTPVIR